MLFFGIKITTRIIARTILMTEAQWDAVEQFRVAHGLKSWSKAVIGIIERFFATGAVE